MEQERLQRKSEALPQIVSPSPRLKQKGQLFGPGQATLQAAHVPLLQLGVPPKALNGQTPHCSVPQAPSGAVPQVRPSEAQVAVAVVQTPLQQVCPELQARPQAPQLLSSVCRLVQIPPGAAPQQAEVEPEQGAPVAPQTQVFAVPDSESRARQRLLLPVQLASVQQAPSVHEPLQQTPASGLKESQAVKSGSRPCWTQMFPSQPIC